jgi:TatD DNase family protein
VIDTHAHLDASADGAAALLERARAAGVTRVVAVGSGLDSCRATLALAEQHEGVYAALGIHPHQAGGEDAERLPELRELLGHERAVAVGETGLDFFRDYAPHDDQLRLFERQLDLARELRKPVVVHSRAADDDTARLLDGFDGAVVLHCFSSPGLLPAALERRYYVSFAGNVTYPKADDLRAAAAEVPADRILAETDTPYLAPVPRRGRPNEPANVVHTVAALASARGEDTAELAARTDANATAAFSLPVASPAQ